jgi:glutaredoxin
MPTNLNSKAVLWSQENCLACNQAKSLLDIKGIPYEVKMLGENATKEELLKVVPNARSVPQIFLNGEYVGGLPELRKLIG